MKKEQKIKRIKENILHNEYIKLMNYLRGDEKIRVNTKNNYLRAFCILYYVGLRLNELQDMRIYHINELINNGRTKIILSKTKSERKIFAKDDFKKELKKIFDIDSEDDENRIISKGSNKNTSINHIVFITAINKYIKSVLGDGYTSHSFRQGIITEMASRGVNTKMIAKFIHHSDVSTTLRYVKPTDEDVENCIIR